MKRSLIVLAAITAVTLMAGCSNNKPQFGDKKEDWAKTAPPPQWRGPGQPGGPPAGAAAGPMAGAPKTAAPPAANRH